MVIIQQFFVLRNLKENSGDSVTPFVEQVFLIFLHVHQFVHDMKLKIECLSINRMLRGTVEMKLQPSHRKVGDVCPTFHQIYEMRGHEIFRVVEGHLILSAGP